MGSGITNLSGLSELALLIAFISLALMILLIVNENRPGRVRQERSRYSDRAFLVLAVICIAALVVLLVDNVA